MALVSVGIVGETHPPLVDHPQTLQVPKSGSHIQSTVSSTVIDSYTSCYPQCSIPDSLLRHPHLSEVGVLFIVR